MYAEGKHSKTRSNLHGLKFLDYRSKRICHVNRRQRTGTNWKKEPRKLRVWWVDILTASFW